jgi:hypothetical protein
VKLEIMFVIEASDFMLSPTDDGKTLLDTVLDSIRVLSDIVRKDEALRGAVRVGFAEYQDTVPKAEFTSRLTCDLTDDFDRVMSKLSAIKATELGDDWPDDVLAGLNEAVTNAKWSENSVKHIVLLGMASCQLNPRGQNPPQAGRYEVIESVLTRPRGFNSTGLSIAQLVSRARPQGGGDSRARTTKMFHALRFGEDPWKGFDPAEKKDIEEKLATIRPVIDAMSRSELSEVAAKPEMAEALRTLFTVEVILHQRKLALAQYQDIARNNGETDGIFETVEPGAENVKRAAARLSEKIRGSFNVLARIREGETARPSEQNEIAQPLFTLVGAAAEKFKDQPVITGTAAVRDQRGREVAFKKVMVSEDELRRLRSTLDALHTKFKGSTNKADRQDVGGILSTMKEVIAETGAGQELTANVKLKDLISDLPLRTAALDTSAADLAVMTTEAFTEWLERLESAVFRIDDLLENRQEWLTLSDRAVNDRFTFLRLSELP